MLSNESGYKENEVLNSSLRDLLLVIFRRRKTVILFFVLIMAVVSALTFLSPDIYRSEASLLVKLGRESVMIDPTATVGQIANVRQDRTNEINSELQILQSRDLFEQVVDKMGLDAFLPEKSAPEKPVDSVITAYWQSIKETRTKAAEQISGWINEFTAGSEEPVHLQRQMEREQIIDRLMKNFSAASVTQSDVITIHYDDRSPETAQLVLRELIKNYLDKHMAVHRTSGSYQFFDRQTEDLRNTLQETGKSLKEMKNRTGLSSIDEQRMLILERIDTLKRALEANEAELTAMGQKASALRRELAQTPKTVVEAQTTGSPNSAMEELRTQIYLLQLEEQELLSKFAEQSVPVKEIRRRIRSAESLLSKAKSSQEVMTGNNPTYQQLEMNVLLAESEHTALKAKAQKLAVQLDQAREELKWLNDHELEMGELQRELKIREASYLKYADSKEQARIDNALQQGKISNISIAQPPTTSIQPVRPKKALNLAFGLFLGIFGGVGLAFFREYMDHTFTSPGEIEKKLGIPSLGSVPKLVGSKVKQIEIKTDNHFYLPTESVKSLSYPGGVQPFAFLQGDTPGKSRPQPTAFSPRIIAVTSSRKGEGASTVSIYLASMLHHHFDKRVLLIDANFESPSLHIKMRGQRSPGLGDILNRKQFDMDMFQATALPGLDFLSIGTERSAHLCLPEKKALGKLLQSLTQKYDFVVLDTPPLWNGGPHATSFEPLADGVVLVVEAEKIRWEVAQRSVDRLQKMKSAILGAVLNKRQFHIPQWIYRNL